MTTCDKCARENCRVGYWTKVVDDLKAGDSRMPLDEAERGLAAARVSCFIRASQRVRYPR